MCVWEQPVGLWGAIFEVAQDLELNGVLLLPQNCKLFPFGLGPAFRPLSEESWFPCLIEELWKERRPEPGAGASRLGGGLIFVAT